MERDMELSLIFCSMMGNSISAKTLWKRTKEGKIPHVRIGNRVLYSVAQLDHWIQQQVKHSSAPVSDYQEDTENREGPLEQLQVTDEWDSTAIP